MTDEAKVVTEDTVNGTVMTYDTSARLTYSKTETNESGLNLNHTYQTETTISNYNTIHQATDQQRTIIDKAKTTIETSTLTYDSEGRVATIDTQVYEH